MSVELAIALVGIAVWAVVMALLVGPRQSGVSRQVILRETDKGWRVVDDYRPRPTAHATAHDALDEALTDEEERAP